MQSENSLSNKGQSNTLRIGLPEWLVEQIDSGIHKGVAWVDQGRKIFKVPWKHASRNGWEQKDVSLFKAWAIYTGRYREGIDKARPALWKTNFRCAVNSHNSLVFLPECGTKTGERAHRVIRIVNDSGKKIKRTIGIQASRTDCKEPRKAVSVKQENKPSFKSCAALPNVACNPISFSIVRSPVSTLPRSCASPVAAKLVPTVLGKAEDNPIELCTSCRELQNNYRAATDNALAEADSDATKTYTYMLLRQRYLEILSSDFHVCRQSHSTDSIMRMHLNTSIEPKHNIQYLYHVGKALQDKNDRTSGKDAGGSVGNIAMAEYEARSDLEVSESKPTDGINQQSSVDLILGKKKSEETEEDDEDDGVLIAPRSEMKTL